MNRVGSGFAVGGTHYIAQHSVSLHFISILLATDEREQDYDNGREIPDGS